MDKINKNSNSTRDGWLNSDDKELIRECEFSAQRRSGKGGQKINKSSSALRLKHIPSGTSVIASESRHQSENRSIALKKLKRKIALEIRTPAKKITLDTQAPSLKNPIYTQWMADLLDTLEQNSYSISAAASDFGCSAGQLIKLLSRDPELWQKLNSERKKRSLKALSANKS